VIIPHYGQLTLLRIAIINVPSEPVVISLGHFELERCTAQAKVKSGKVIRVERTWCFPLRWHPTVINVNLTVETVWSVWLLLQNSYERDIVMGTALSAVQSTFGWKTEWPTWPRREMLGGSTLSESVWDNWDFRGSDGHNQTPTLIYHSVHHIRNPNSLPPVPDTDNRLSVRKL